MRNKTLTERDFVPFGDPPYAQSDLSQTFPPMVVKSRTSRIANRCGSYSHYSGPQRRVAWLAGERQLEFRLGHEPRADEGICFWGAKKCSELGKCMLRGGAQS